MTPDTAARARALVAALTHVAPDRVEMLAPDSYAAALAALDERWNAAVAACSDWLAGIGHPVAADSMALALRRQKDQPDA